VPGRILRKGEGSEGSLPLVLRFVTWGVTSGVGKDGASRGRFTRVGSPASLAPVVMKEARRVTRPAY
jgi:hypothetical protein